MSNDQQTPAPEKELEPNADFAPEQQSQEAAPAEAEVPEKFKGKSLTEIVASYQNLESELGRARNEMGQVRRLADELLGIRVAAHASVPAKPVERKKLTPEDLLNNPEDSILSAVTATVEEREKALLERQARLEAEFAMQRFERKHPDYQTTMADQKFTDWVQKSNLRLSLAQAATQGNVAAADELFTLYGEMSMAQPAEPEAPSPTAQARKASLTRPGGGSAAGGKPSGGSSQKVWNRAELMKMRIENPDEFDRLQPEILKAYAEKRVK